MRKIKARLEKHDNLWYAINCCGRCDGFTDECSPNKILVDEESSEKLCDDDVLKFFELELYNNYDSQFAKIINSNNVEESDIHPKILAFASEMQKELNNNAHKGNWEEWKDVSDMIVELEYHKSKLIIAMRNSSHEKVKEYLADCANILLCIGNTGNLY